MDATRTSTDAASGVPCHRQQRRDRGRVVVGVDDSDAGLAALRWAVSFARSRQVPLVAVRAWQLAAPAPAASAGRRGRPVADPVFKVSRARADALSLTRQAFHAVTGHAPHELRAQVELPEGPPGRALTRIAVAKQDVLVVGTRQRLPGRRARRSVSAYCTRHSRHPVVVVAGTGPGQWEIRAGRYCVRPTSEVSSRARPRW